VFFFQIREQFDSLDLKHLEQLRDEQAKRPPAHAGDAPAARSGVANPPQ
jgi:hypothetical protein